MTSKANYSQGRNEHTTTNMYKDAALRNRRSLMRYREEWVVWTVGDRVGRSKCGLWSAGLHGVGTKKFLSNKIDLSAAILSVASFGVKAVYPCST